MSDLKMSVNEQDLIVDSRTRGFPAGHAAMTLAQISTQGWKPYDGKMSLPLISVDERAFANNIDWMMRYVRDHQVEIAPHAKTPMSTTIAATMLASGAWGTTVADIRQAAVMLAAGQRRLILANEIGGLAAVRRLAALLVNYPDAEVHAFVDSVELAQFYKTVWAENSALPKLGLLVEVGVARAGARTLAEAQAIAEAILSGESENLILSGVATYEGAAGTPSPTETIARVKALLDLLGALYRFVRTKVGADRLLIVTAGGSAFFDLVVEGLEPVLAGDKQAQIVLRSGAIFFHDHGVYERGLAAIDARNGFMVEGKLEKAIDCFVPALRLWAEVLSCPETGLVVCGMGMRDVAMDQDLPRPLAVYRDGQLVRALSGVSVVKLNDQHAFVATGDQSDIAIGDVIEFGISHPCTCLDRHALFYGLDDSHAVIGAYPASFG